MIRSRSRALQRFLDLKSIRENPPADLKRRLISGNDADRFTRQAFKTGAEALWIQSAESMVRHYADSHQTELRWLLLYFLELSARGHIRISAEDIREDFPLWAAPAFEAASEIVKELTALILDNPRLFASLDEGRAPLLYAADYSYFYLLKKRRFEENFLEALGNFTDKEQQPIPFPGQSLLLDDLYKELKESAPMPMSDDTLRAAHMLNNSRLSIITGGPGTGKTTILAGLLNLYLESCLRNCEALPEVRLCAPTGRAAKRMTESMEPLFKNERMAPAFLHSAETIHKTLGLKPGTLPRFDEFRSLQADIFVVDEASMVDLSLMTMILKAMKPDARILLVGDRDQLPSVESGALLSDLLHGLGSKNHRMNDRVVSLTTVHRNSGAIRDLSRMILEADRSSFSKFLQEPERELSPLDILRAEGGLVRSASLPSYRILLDEIISLLKKNGPLPGSSGFSIHSVDWYKKRDDISACFTGFKNLAVLTPTRKGLYGTSALNRGLNELLSPQNPEAYHGQAVMVTRNDYERNLFNGDRGVVLRFKDGLFACFEDSVDEYRLIPLPLLEDLETAYALTIHKSQGSEFKCVYVLIPEGSERLLSREILYTGITRAREGLILYGSQDTFELCLSRAVRRLSGIRDFMLA